MSRNPGVLALARSGRPLESRFYSPLSRAVALAPGRLNGASATNWAQWLKSNAPKLGVKADEIEWTGIQGYFALRGRDELRKDELLTYLDAHGVRISEMIAGGLPHDELMGQLYEARDAAAANVFSGGTWQINGAEYADDELGHLLLSGDVAPASLPAAVRDSAEQWLSAINALSSLREVRTLNPQYAQYCEPGGENYREILITLPTAEASKVARRAELAALDRERPLNAQEQARYDELVSYAKGGRVYRSKHWQVPNVIAHIRLTDRVARARGFVVRNIRSGHRSEVFASPEEAVAFQGTLPPTFNTEVVEASRSLRVLFVEEIQSDWGQDGKSKGFASSVEVVGYRFDDQRNDWVQAPDHAAEQFGAGGTCRDDRLFDSRELAEKQLLHVAIPDGPFVTKTEAWLNLALKRVILLAVDGGYDKVSFVTGEQCVSRYKLSKKAELLIAAREADGRFRIFMRDLEGKNHDAGAFSGEELDAVVGKELALRIMAQEKDHQTYEGLDLDVGGEGMRAFYDEIVPRALNKLLPKLGGERLHYDHFSDPEWGVFDAKGGPLETGFPTKEKAIAVAADYPGSVIRNEGGDNQPSFAVTEQMCKTVATGVPLFSRRSQAYSGSVDVHKTANTAVVAHEHPSRTCV